MSTRVDRREFIAAAGAVAAAAYVPAALAAEPAQIGSPTPRATLADWHVDDMWGVYPRPHEAIGYGRPHGDGELVARVEPVDLAFLA